MQKMRAGETHQDGGAIRFCSCARRGEKWNQSKFRVSDECLKNHQVMSSCIVQTIMSEVVSSHRQSASAVVIKSDVVPVAQRLKYVFERTNLKHG